MALERVQQVKSRVWKSVHVEAWIDRADEVLIEAQAEERVAEQRRKAQTTKTCLQWLQTALKKGSKNAHRWTTQTVTSAHSMDYQNSTTPQQSMQARTKEWGNRWNRHIEARDILLRQMHEPRLQALSTAPRTWTTDAVLHTLSRMQGIRAGGVDGWNLSEMLRLPRRAFDGLAKVLQTVENTLALPTQRCVNVVALLGKPSGYGQRPTTLTGCLYAIYMAGCQNEMRNWDSEYHGWWDDAVKGNSALQSGLLRPVYEEVASLNGQSAACVFVDMEKFCDSACFYKLVDHAMATEFPRRLLYIAMEAYLSDRILRAEHLVGQSIQPSNGILAGCSLGNMCEGHPLQDLGQCEQRLASAAARSSGDASVCG